MHKCIICNSAAGLSVVWEKSYYKGKFRKCDECLSIIYDGNESADYAQYGQYLMITDIDAYLCDVTKKNRALLNYLKETSEIRSILVVGSGNGALLRIIKDSTCRNINLLGIEPSDLLVNYSKEIMKVINCKKGYLLDKSLSDEKWDCIIIQDVIEHIDIQLLQSNLVRIRELLSSGGVVIGNTPNCNSINVKILGYKDPVVSPPYHQILFSVKGLRTLFERNEFVTKMVKTNNIDIRGFIRINGKDTGSKFEEKVISLRDSKKYKFAFYFVRIIQRSMGHFAGMFNLGSNIDFIFEKK